MHANIQRINMSNMKYKFFASVCSDHGYFLGSADRHKHAYAHSYGVCAYIIYIYIYIYIYIFIIYLYM